MLFTAAATTVAVSAVSEGAKKAGMYFAGGMVAGVVAYKVGDVAYSKYLEKNSVTTTTSTTETKEEDGSKTTTTVEETVVEEEVKAS
jgi:hypothetical protein